MTNKLAPVTKSKKPLTKELLSFPQLPDAAPDPILITNVKGQIYYANPAWERITGYTFDEVKGKNPRLLSNGKTKKNIYKKLWKALSEGKSFSTDEIHDKRKDGTEYQLHSTFFPIVKRKKNIFYVQLMYDITRQKRYQYLLEEKEKKYRFLMEQASDAIIIHDLKRKIVDVNLRACEMFGLTRKEFLHIYANQLIKSEDVILTHQAIKSVMSGLPVIIEREAMRKDGTSFTIEVSSKKIEKNLVQSIIRDVSQRKKIEDVLRFRDQILLHMAEGVCIVALSNHKIIYANPAFNTMLGYAEDELTGKNVSVVNGNRKIWTREITEKITNAIKRDGAWSGEVQNVKKNDIPVVTLATISLVTYPTFGKCWIGVHQDITERKELERQKDAFIGIASHELKTPITSLVAYAQLLEKRFRQNGNKKDKYFIANIVSQTERLTELVDDLLHVSSLQSGKMALYLQEIDINKLIREVVIDFQYTTASHEIIEEGTLQETVLCDKNRIQQVLTNLLTNAIKYSPNNNKIIIKLYKKKNDVIVAVQDFGIGIAKKDLPNIFNRFYRTMEKKERVEGFGLGLFISSEIIKRHKGKIWVESQKGKGSTFYFSLPLKKQIQKN